MLNTILNTSRENIFHPFDQYALSGGSFVRRGPRQLSPIGAKRTDENGLFRVSHLLYFLTGLCRLHNRGRVLTEEAALIVAGRLHVRWGVKVGGF